MTTLHSAELAGIADRFRLRLAEAVADPPTPLTVAQRAQLSRQARLTETALTALDWELAHSWLPIQEAFAHAITPPDPGPPLRVDRAAHRRKTRHRNRRTR